VRPRAAVARPAVDVLPLAMRVAFAGAALLFFVMLARAIEARITWYLAVDQFGYLQFAHDLLRGKVMHEWAPARLLADALPLRTDMLAQTYVWDHGELYCRYAPGFPLLVAAWLALFGDPRISFLNPAVYLAFLGVVIACTWRLTGSAWRGMVVAALMVLCPTRMYWWSLTLTRDLSSHLFAFTGLYLLLPVRGRRLTAGRVLAAGSALGYAASIRNDAVLYLISAGLVLVLRWFRSRPARARTPALAGALVGGVLLGLLPTFVFNGIATGNPLQPTQGMEVADFLPKSTPSITESGPKVGHPSRGWKGGAVWQVQGGGLRLDNFSKTFPGNWNYMRSGFSPLLLGIATLGAVLALIQRPLLFALTVPYMVVAFLFYSCWARPDQRYIIGVFTCTCLLITEGVFGPIDLVRRIARGWGETTARNTAAAFAVAGVAVAVFRAPIPQSIPDTMDALSVLVWILPLAGAVGAAAAAMMPSRRISAVLAPALAIVLVGITIQQANATVARRAPFQQPQAELARDVMRRALEPKSIVITTEDIGRPAENIEYYGGFPSLYVTDLDRWKLNVGYVTTMFMWGGYRPYLLLHLDAPERAAMIRELEQGGAKVEKIADIPPNRNMEYFVAAPFHRGLPLVLYRISHPVGEDAIRTIGRKRPGSP